MFKERHQDPANINAPNEILASRKTCTDMTYNESNRLHVICARTGGVLTDNVTLFIYLFPYSGPKNINKVK